MNKLVIVVSKVNKKSALSSNFMPCWQNGNATSAKMVSHLHQTDRTFNFISLKTMRITVLQLKIGGGGPKLDFNETRRTGNIIKPFAFVLSIATSGHALAKWPLSHLCCQLQEFSIDWYWFSCPPLPVLKRRKISNSIEVLKHLQMYQVFVCETWCYDQIPVWMGN